MLPLQLVSALSAKAISSASAANLVSSSACKRAAFASSALHLTSSPILIRSASLIKVIDYASPANLVSSLAFAFISSIALISSDSSA